MNPLRKLVRRPLVLGGTVVLVSVALFALLAPWISPYESTAMKVLERLRGPSMTHWFGTDELGRDVFSRVIFGGRYSLWIGALVVLLSVSGGVVLGLMAGFFRRHNLNGSEVDVYRGKEFTDKTLGARQLDQHFALWATESKPTAAWRR